MSATKSDPLQPPVHVASLLKDTENFLAAFSSLEAHHPGRVPWSLSFNFGRHDQHVVLGSIIHGNEVGSLPALLRLGEELSRQTTDKSAYGGKLTIFLGNVPASKKNVRFLEADLNRLFFDQAPPSWEACRAKELMPLLAEASIFLDFHQTVQPSLRPFYIFGYHEASYLWARALSAANLLVTRQPGTAFSEGTVCGDEFTRGRGIPAVTLELGQQGYSDEAARITYEAATRAMHVAEMLGTGTGTLEGAAASCPELDFLEIVERRPYRDPLETLTPGLKNFTWIESGETLGKRGETPIIADKPGYLLFPKYPPRDAQGRPLVPVSGELFLLADKLPGHPREVFAPKTGSSHRT